MHCKLTPPMLIGSAWEKVMPMQYLDEPTRPLVFWTQRHARLWCIKATARYRKHDSHWHFRAVRVRETIKVLPFKTAKGKF